MAEVVTSASRSGNKFVDTPFEKPKASPGPKGPIPTLMSPIWGSPGPAPGARSDFGVSGPGPGARITHESLQGDLSQQKHRLFVKATTNQHAQRTVDHTHAGVPQNKTQKETKENQARPCRNTATET